MTTTSFYPLQRLWQVENLKPFSEWFQINWQGQMVGWSTLQLKEKSDSYKVLHEEHFEGRVRGKRMKFSYQYDWAFSKQPPYRLTKGRAILIEPDLKMTTDFVNDDKLSITQVRNAMTRNFVEQKLNYNLSNFLELRAFIEQRPKKGRKTTHLKLDPHSLEASKLEYQVLAIPAGRHQRYLLSSLSGNAKLNGLSFSRQGKVLKQSRPRAIELVASSKKPSFNPEMQRDLYTSNGLKIMQPLGALENVDHLTLSLAEGSDDWFTVHPSAKLRSGSGIITRQSATYAAKPQEQKRWAFYPPHEKVSSISPKVDKKKDKRAIVKQLLTFTHNFLYYKATPSSFSIDEVVANGYGDCTEYSQLLLELLNAAKIPAREVAGYIYLGDDEQRFGGHEWVEVLIDGEWVGVDPTWNLMHTTVGHLPITLSREKSASDLVFTVEKIHYN